MLTVKAIERSWTRRRRAVLAVSFALMMLNDLVFFRLGESYAIYLVDYAIKPAALLLTWDALRGHAPPAARPASSFLHAALFALCVAAGLIACAIDALFDPGWTLFRWPVIAQPGLKLLDLTAGLALSSTAEEMVYRRLALVALPFSPGINVALSSVLFGLIHWGEGYVAIVTAACVGLTFALAYRRTGLLWPIVLAHYVVNLYIFR